MPVVLLIRENEDLHSVLLSNKALILGRSSSCDIRLSDDRVSGKHLAIKLNTQGKVMIKDLGTTNGTFLNGSQIQESYLMLRDELLIGSVTLKLDPSQLNAKEKLVLTREEATQMKYIKLDPQPDTSSKKPAVPKKPAQSPPEEKSPTLIFNENGEAIIPKPETVAVPDQDHSSKPNSEIKDRLVAKAQNASKVKSGTVSAPMSDEPLFDMEKSTGQTKMIQIDTADLKEAASKKIVKKKKIKKADQEITEKKSLLEKVISLFKK